MKKKNPEKYIVMKEPGIRKRKIVTLLALVFITSVGVLYSSGYFKKKSLSEYATDVLQICRESQYRPSCYDKEIPKLMKHISLEDAFKVTQIVQTEDPKYVYCHVLAHKLSYEESKKSKDGWKDVLTRCPLNMCNYGCLHGSLTERFRGEVLTAEQINSVLPDLADVCEKRKGFSPSEIDSSMCYHALGHLAMYITDGKPDKAIEVCKRVSIKPDGRDYTTTCVQGAFMTVFQGVDPEDIALVKEIKPDSEHVAQFCNQYGEFWWSCRRESFPLYLQKLKVPENLVEFCSYSTEESIMDDCYLSVLNVIAVDAFEDSDGLPHVSRYCEKLPYSRQGICYEGIAMRLVQINPRDYLDQAIEVCNLGHSAGVDADCFEGLVYYGYASFIPGSPDSKAYCSKLPGEWSYACDTRSKEYAENKVVSSF